MLTELGRQWKLVEALSLLNGFMDLESALSGIAPILKELTGASSVGIRAESNGLLPFVAVTEGFPCASGEGCCPGAEGGCPGDDILFGGVLPESGYSTCTTGGTTTTLMPMVAGGMVFGLIHIVGFDMDGADPDLLGVLRTITGQMGVAATNRMAYRFLEESGELSRENEYRLRSLFETMGEGVALFDAVYGKDGGITDFRFIEVNRTFEVLIGMSRETIIGSSFREATKGSFDDITDKLTRVMDTGEEERFTYKADTFDKWFSVVAYRCQDTQLAVLFSDITEKKKADEAILRLSMYDTLTGVYNRHFMEREMGRLEMSDVTPCGIILGDLNGLKLTNDALGHEAGDALLRRCAGTLVDTVDSRGTVGRWGGDEFIILVPNAGEDMVEALCESMRAEFSKDESQLIPLSMALGWSCKTLSGRSLQPILREAENRMYHNKLMQGRGVRSAFISSLRRTLLEKAYETEEHSSRLSKLGVAMGKVIGLPQNQLDDLALLCVLHDIGKIGTPDDILKKPGKLTEEEWEIMKRHSEVGYRIANASQELSHISYAILCHHERWDGKGYPLGIRSSNIPLISRIVAIADSYDAMTAGRAYSRAKTKEEAIEELKGCAGTQFDPSLTEVAVSILKGGKPERRSHAVSMV